MFKMFKPTFFVVPVAWLTVLALAGLNVATPVLASLGIAAKTSWAVLIVQLVVTAFFVTPAWRFFWWALPQLNYWVFPDLNGEWDLQLDSNWSRIDAGLAAGKSSDITLDLRDAPEDQLPALFKRHLKAKIIQSWADIKIIVWDPKSVGPINDSETLVVQPFRGEAGRHGLVYVFEQENQTATNSDDRKFLGATRVFVDRHDPNILSGLMWTDRMWRRGMNTAADVRWKRASTTRKKLASAGLTDTLPTQHTPGPRPGRDGSSTRDTK